MKLEYSACAGPDPNALAGPGQTTSTSGEQQAPAPQGGQGDTTMPTPANEGDSNPVTTGTLHALDISAIGTDGLALTSTSSTAASIADSSNAHTTSIISSVLSSTHISSPLADIQSITAGAASTGITQNQNQNGHLRNHDVPPILGGALGGLALIVLLCSLY